MENLIQKIEDARRIINKRYCMNVENVVEIRNNSDDEFRLMSNCFVFGYMQGMKAAKAETRKKKAGVLA